jgi:exopolysaccharide production protein ExoY
MTAPFDPSRSAPETALRSQAAETAPVFARMRRRTLYARGLKRLVDLLLVISAAPFVVLTVALLALVIACDGGSPFYSQVRIGKDGRPYRMWKLRTMISDADARLEAHLATHPEAREEWDRTQKLRHDPRVTSFGRALRKSSLDELPQLWNVLVGDMSLVGPRPMMPSQQPLYPGSAYYRLRPGITGMWQVSSRNNSGFAERAVFDQEYERRLSFAIDLRLILVTLAVVLKGTGH